LRAEGTIAHLGRMLPPHGRMPPHETHETRPSAAILGKTATSDDARAGWSLRSLFASQPRKTLGSSPNNLCWTANREIFSVRAATNPRPPQARFGPNRVKSFHRVAAPWSGAGHDEGALEVVAFGEGR